MFNITIIAMKEAIKAEWHVMLAMVTFTLFVTVMILLPMLYGRAVVKEQWAQYIFIFFEMATILSFVLAIVINTKRRKQWKVEKALQ